MFRFACAVLLAGALVVPQAASAQRTIRVGQTVDAALAASDPTLEDGSHYHIYTFQVEAGQRYAVTMRSTAFDAFLTGGPGADGAAPECDACTSDDDGAGDGTDARLRFTARESGVYAVRANSLSGGETGDYTLTLEKTAPAAVVRSSGELTLGHPASGMLDQGDAVAEDDSYFDEWTFRATATGRVAITMRSTDFDTYLRFGTGSGDDFEEIESNDDGEDTGTDAQMVVEVEAGRVYTIHANSLSSGDTGAYTLVIEPAR